ncbi:hypothetical protein, partial [uncultured Tateyamaria sp.]|uniref:hypothetical protein n=1 Tax=uncultured Tateyamaria sp. TaxID=455651 RepID=UPI0026278DEE
MSPPDTLVTSSRYDLYDQNRNFNNDRFLIEMANEKKFSVVINISRIDSMSMSRLRAVLAQNMYHE